MSNRQETQRRVEQDRHAHEEEEEEEIQSAQQVAPTQPSLTFLPPWYRDWNFFYVIVLGVGVMCVITAYWTAANIGQNLVEGMKKYGFVGNESFISLCIMYAFTVLVTPVVPIIIDFISAKWALLAGCITMVLYVAAFLIPNVTVLFGASVLIGIGYALEIASLGTIFTYYSTPATVERNMAFLWGVLNFSLIWGNLFVAVKFQHMDVIDDSNRTMAAWVLVGISSCGCLVLTTLGKPRLYKPILPPNFSESDFNAATDDTSPIINAPDVQNNPTPPKTRRKISRKLFMKKMFQTLWAVCKSSTIRLCFCSMLFYGVESTFFSAVFPTAVGFNQHFGDAAKSLAGLCGVIVGVGEITGGLATAVVSKYAGRHTTVLIGFVCSALGFIAAVVNVPQNSSLYPSNGPILLASSSAVLAVITAYLLGVGDACLSTSVYSLISDVFGEYDKAIKADKLNKNNNQESVTDNDDDEPLDDAATTAAFAVMNGAQALATALTFAASTLVPLPWLALVFGVVGAASSISYFEAHHRFTQGRLKFCPVVSSHSILSVEE